MKNFITICTFLFLTSSAFCSVDDIVLIRRAYEDKLYLFVEERAQEFLKDSKNNDLTGVIAQEVRHKLIGSYVHRGFYKNALNHILEFEKDFPKSNLLHLITFFKAKCYYKKYVEMNEVEFFKDKKRPAELLKTILPKLNKQSLIAEAFFIRGKDLYYDESYLEAINVFDKLTKRYKSFKNYEEALFYLGRSYYYTKIPLYEKALNIFSKLIKKNQRSANLAEYHFWLGECFYEMNKINLALESFSKALLTKPDKNLECDIHYNLGWLYAGLGKIEEAKNSFSKLMAKDLIDYSQRYFASTKYKLASLYMLQKEYQKCLLELQDILDVNETRHEASLLSGQAYMHLNSWLRAKEFLSIASEDDAIKEIKLEAKKNLSTVYFELKEYEKALGVLDSMVSMQVPLDYRIDIQLQKAEILFGSGSIYQAQGIYRDLLLEGDESLAPGLHYKLALCAMKTNPVVECFYEREKLKNQEDKTENEADFEALHERLSRVLTQCWDEAKDSNSILSKIAITDGLNIFISEDLEELRKTQEETFIEANKGNSGGNIIIPTTIHKDSMLFVELKKRFIEGFKNNKYGTYKEFLSKAPMLSRYYRSLQTVNILSHLDVIIRRGLENPFLALAYYEKAMLVKSQKLIEVAIENLQLAIKHTADLSLKSDYYIQLSYIRYEDAKNEKDQKEKNIKIQATLNIINEVASLGQVVKDEIAYLRYACYSLIQENSNARDALLEYLQSSNDFDGLNRIEEQLISHYFKVNRNIKAADQKMQYAIRLEKREEYSDKIIKLKYEAADLYLENADTFDRGSTILLELAKSASLTEWSFKALIRSFHIYKKKGDQKEIANIISKLNQIGDIKPLRLKCEKEYLLGEYYLYIEEYAKAFEKFKWVIDKAGATSSIRSKAYIEYAKMLKLKEPAKAASAFLDFYYLFPKDSKRQLALFQSCRLRIKNFKAMDSGTDEQKKEIKKLIAKLEDNEEQKKLLLFLEN